MTKNKHLWVRLTAILLLTLIVVPLRAQDSTSTTRDAQAMAQRWLGWSGGPVIAPPPLTYNLNDSSTFWVTKAGHASPSQITAKLAAITLHLNVWVEDGLDFKPNEMLNVAAQIDATMVTIRMPANQGVIVTAPQSRDEFINAEQIPLPDVDGDGRYNILFAHDLNTTNIMSYNPVNSVPTQYVANGWTNQQEIFIINTSAAPSLSLGAPAYVQLVVRKFYSLLVEHNNPSQAPWLREAQSWYMWLQSQQQDIGPADFQTFFQTPDLPLTSTDTERAAITAVGQMFLRYVEQRFGAGIVQELFTSNGSGLDQLTSVLAANGMTDLVTDKPITGQDVFADFALANALNNVSVGDGRFGYTMQAATGLSAATRGAQDNFDFQIPRFSVEQYGTNYLALSATKSVEFQLAFDGIPVIPRLLMPNQPDNHFYWSGDGLYQNTSFSRTFDLSAVQSATLTFDAWHQLTEGWNYGYVSVSTDGGQTFKPLISSGSTTLNPNGLSYGAGFTGVSNPQPARPFPYLGIGLAANGITISSIADNSPLQGLDVKVGDTIAGFDGQPWQGKADVTAYLSGFKPGDTVNLYLQRDDKFLSVPVVLGKHPSRVIPADPIWTQQEINLNAYAGKQITLRFDYVSSDDKPDKGIAIDNIAIPEIGFKDDAEAGIQGWTLNGWQQIDNTLSQHYVVQYAIINSNTPTVGRIERLIAPGDNTTSGAWPFSLTAGDTFVLAISGINDATDLPAIYNLRAQTIGTPQPEATPEVTATPAP